MGVSTVWGRLLAPPDLAFVDVGRESFWPESRGVSLHECGTSRRQRWVALLVATDVDRSILAEFGGGRAICPASAARGVGGLGDGTQGCAQRLLRPARADILRPLRATQNTESSDTHHAPRTTHHAPRFTFHLSRPHLLSPLPVLLRLWPDE